MLHCQKVGERHSTKIANGSLEDVAKFKYLGTTPTDQYCMNDEIKSRLNLGNASYHSVQSIVSSCLLSRNVEVHALRDEHRVRLFLKRIFGPKSDDVMGK
jgi:hypothetical protein